MLASYFGQFALIYVRFVYLTLLDGDLKEPDYIIQKLGYQLNAYLARFFYWHD